MDTVKKNAFSSLLRLVHSAGVENRDYKRLSQEINESNRRAVLIFSITSTVFLMLMVIISFFVDNLASSRMLYSISAAATGLVVILICGPAKRSGKLTLVLMYFFIGTLMFFGIILGTVTVPKEITATYIALLLTVPQMFTDRPWRMYLMILVSDLIFVNMVITHKDPITWSSDIINCFIFGGLSCVVCTYMSKIKVERFLLVDTVRFMAENDQLTGLKNRNSYELRLSNARRNQADSIFCIYVDVNGLHELNNSQGHAAGDRMLQYIATVMQNIYGRENTYRIGGDEYVAFGTNQDVAHMEAMTEKLRSAVDAAGYHIAIGTCHQDTRQDALDTMVKTAEANMYADKKEYYTRHPHKRSRH